MRKASLQHAATVGVFIMVLYILCLLWRFSMTDPAVANFHLLALKTAFPGFQGFDLLSMVLGAAISFIYGFIGSVIFHALHCNSCCEKK